jgi:Thioesterase-like superfamily
MLFSETLGSLRRSETGWKADIGEDWSQGRATFGGLVAALGNEAMRRHVTADRPLRGLNITFAGPVVPGNVDIDVQVFREGKAVTIAQANLISAGAIAASVTGIYGSSRATSIIIPHAAAASARGVEELAEFTLSSGLGGPAFMQHFGLRWAEGTSPYTATPLTRSKAYIRHRDTATLSESHAVALIDCIPSPVLQMMSKPAPASSLIWMLEFLCHDYKFATDAWWRIDTEVPSSVDGYASQTSLITNPAGVPAALSRQLVAVFG